MKYEQTSVWQKALGKSLDLDPHEKQKELIRIEFEKFRENAKLLSTEIANVLPDFTVHDISHIDALWETTELVTHDDFILTPAEVFVLGGTFLIHDLGMGIASFPNGIEELKKEDSWKDTVASMLKEKLQRPVTTSDLENIDKSIEKQATENVLRRLHAKNAEKLALISWKDKSGKDLYLIDNLDLREAYGRVIGLIAYSHGCSVEYLAENLPPLLGAPGIFPNEWTVDPIKLACILRIADATQIDDKRAPTFLMAIRKPRGYSELHWNFQNRLYQPRLENNRLVYTSKTSFNRNEIECWWLCNDTLKIIDNELRSVDSLLLDTSRQRLKATSIAAIEDPIRLSKLITVEGWQPVDTKVKVTNVAKLVNNLGGEQLYGNNLIVPLRELIQNASDAIRARRKMENKNVEFGDIIVRVGEDEFGKYIEVRDNGVGMSYKVLTSYFLDFGESFWGSQLMHEEFPGLESKDFGSTGKYGIGFYSVFMWGEHVKISTKSYKEGWDSTLVMEFQEGVFSRPILRKAEGPEIIKDGGTTIRVWPSDKSIFEKLLNIDNILGGLYNDYNITMEEMIGMLCPSMDCNIVFESESGHVTVVKANDWMSMEPLELLIRQIGKSHFEKLDRKTKNLLTKISKNMLDLQEKDGTVVGRLALCWDDIGLSRLNILYRSINRRKSKNSFAIDGQVTIGGLYASNLTGLLGILVGKSQLASRNDCEPLVSVDALSNWATQQSKLLKKQKIDIDTEMLMAAIIQYMTGDTGSLKIVYHRKKPLNYEGLKNIILKTNYNSYKLLYNGNITGYEEEHKCTIDVCDDLICIWDGWLPPLIRSVYPWIRNYGIDEDKVPMTLAHLAIKAISECWGMDMKDVLKRAKFSSKKRGVVETIGTINGKEIKKSIYGIIVK